MLVHRLFPLNLKNKQVDAFDSHFSSFSTFRKKEIIRPSSNLDISLDVTDRLDEGTNIHSLLILDDQSFRQKLRLDYLYQ